MSIPLVITATANSNQTGVVIREVSGVSRVSLSNIILYFYQGADLIAYDNYQLSSGEAAEFIANGVIELLFTDMFGATLGILDDDWWTVEMRSNSDGYISNQYGFGLFSNIEFQVYSLLNNDDIPDRSKKKSEELRWIGLILDRMKYLDTSSTNDRSIAFLNAKTTLEKLLGV